MKYVFASRKPRKCPCCGEGPVASILFGMPVMSPELEQKLTAQKVVLGGCCVTIPSPKWRCTRCGTDIYHERDQIMLEEDA